MAPRARHTVLPGFLLVVAVALLAAGAGGAGLDAPADPLVGNETDANATGPYPGNTLIGIQAEGWFGNDNGSARVVTPDGEVVWTYDPESARVFDVEALANGNILASVAVVEHDADCPDGLGDRCVRNRVVELAYPDTEEVWVYEWYDAFPEHHEVHDADRLENGQTAIVDMGNDRAFTVNRDGQITWQWNATEHLTPGTPFWEEHVPAGSEDEYRRDGPESDWTHMNDIDRLSAGTFQLSIRNFDTVVEVDPDTGEIVDTVGEPGAHHIMREQHNPMRLANGTLLVADSENDRIVEIDTATDDIVWTYDGTGSGQLLQWPRDADRLPNGNTLVTDSRNFRVLEIDRSGEVVWSYSMAERRGILYEADRIGVPEESTAVPSGREFRSRSSSGHIASALATANSWLAFVPFLPTWAGVLDLLGGLLAAVAAVWLVLGWRRAPRR